MRITPIDIQQQQFKSKMVGGYDQQEVDRFLEQLAEELEQSNLENQQLRDDLNRAKNTLEELKEREATLKETLITTQRVTDDLKANAKRDAELVIANAQLRAERILQETDSQRQQILAEMQELRRQKLTFEMSLRGTLETHLRLLDLENETKPSASAPAGRPAAAAPRAALDPEMIDQSLF